MNMAINYLKNKKIRNQIGKLARKLGEKAFICFVILVLFALLLGGLILYKYTAEIKRTQINHLEGITNFDESAYRRILQAWQDREAKFIEIDSKQYKNPFEGQLPEELTNQQF
jgi:hypothetical protein